MSSYKELLAQAEELRKQAEELRLKEMSSVIAQIKQQMADYGITVDDLSTTAGKRGASKTAGSKVEPKYRNTDGATWTGRGKRPTWVSAHIEAGGSLDDLLINK